MLFFKLTEFFSICERKQIKQLSSVSVFSAFSLGCSDKTISSSLPSMKVIILVNSLFMYYINLKILSRIDASTYLHLLLTLYYLFTCLGCIMIITCVCRSSQ